MAVRISFEFYGDTQLERTLEDIAERAEDMRPVWDVLADRFVELEKRQFASQGAYASGGWQPLSERYGRWKATNYPGQTILRREDELYDSLTQRPLGLEVMEASFMVIGSDVEHGRYHQRGDGVPRRRPVEFRENERVEWARLIQRFIMTGSVGGARGSNLRPRL